MFDWFWRLCGKKPALLPAPADTTKQQVSVLQRLNQCTQFQDLISFANAAQSTPPITLNVVWVHRSLIPQNELTPDGSMINMSMPHIQTKYAAQYPRDRDTSFYTKEYVERITKLSDQYSLEFLKCRKDLIILAMWSSKFSHNTKTLKYLDKMVEKLQLKPDGHAKWASTSTLNPTIISPEHYITQEIQREIGVSRTLVLGPDSKIMKLFAMIEASKKELRDDRVILERLTTSADAPSRNRVATKIARIDGLLTMWDAQHTSLVKQQTALEKFFTALNDHITPLAGLIEELAVTSRIERSAARLEHVEDAVATVGYEGIQLFAHRIASIDRSLTSLSELALPAKSECILAEEATVLAHIGQLFHNLQTASPFPALSAAATEVTDRAPALA